MRNLAGKKKAVHLFRSMRPKSATSAMVARVLVGCIRNHYHDDDKQSKRLFYLTQSHRLAGIRTITLSKFGIPTSLGRMLRTFIF